MYIRIEFENLDSIETRKTKQEFCSATNGLCLTSTNSHFIYVDEALKPRCKVFFWYLVDEALKPGCKVFFWYVDVDIVNKYYGGVMVYINTLLEQQGVRHVDVLPIEGPCCEKSHNFTEKFAQFIDGVD